MTLTILSHNKHNYSKKRNIMLMVIVLYCVNIDGIDYIFLNIFILIIFSNVINWCHELIA